MRYRAYFRTPDGEQSTCEFEANGSVVRICDDHGRTVWDDAYSRPKIAEGIMEIAAELVNCRHMPSSFRQDWKELPPRMTRKGWTEIYRAAMTANDVCKNWGFRLRKLANALR